MFPASEELTRLKAVGTGSACSLGSSQSTCPATGEHQGGGRYWRSGEAFATFKKNGLVIAGNRNRPLSVAACRPSPREVASFGHVSDRADLW